MMTAAFLALLLAQAGGTPTSGGVTLAPPESPPPRLAWNGAPWCVSLEPSPQVPSGRYRVQCDPMTRRCLVAPTHELNADGTESDRPLARVLSCDEGTEATEAIQARVAQGYTFVPALAEAPPGWYRDERGRLMQFNFDLHRRVWLGGMWAPLWRHGEERSLGRGRVDFGVITEFPRGEKLMRRLHLFDTELVLGEQPSLDSTLLRYDTNEQRDEPPIRVSTFLGRPRRFDAQFNLGLWVEVLRLELLRRSGSETTFFTLGATHLTLDLWHSKDLSSYVRVRAGPSLEYDRTHRFVTFVPGATLEGDLTLDTNGFHHLTFAAEAEKVLLDSEVESRPHHPERLRVRAGYELILLAINDQPVSLVLDGRGQWRSDLAGVPPVWEWSANTGLRFSMWAPTRRSAPLASDR